MSEQLPAAAVPPEEEIMPPAADLSEADEPAERRGRSGWVAPAWFFFGILVGIVGFAAYTALTVKPVDPAAMRASARDGVLEAIATLQAGGGPQQQPPAAQQPQGPQVVASNTFSVREANRQGSPDAPVTIYEFSDFQ